MAEPSILGALRDPQFRSDTLRNLVEALNGTRRSLTVGSLGAVGDMGSTLANLVRAGAGTAYHETTGQPIPQSLEYRDPARDFGTSASLGNFAEQQGWLPPQTGSIPEQAGALLGPIAAMGLPDLGNSTLRGMVSALKSEPSRRMVEGFVDSMGGRQHIFAGEQALTADRDMLTKAQALERAGANERAIWADTGWFKGADGKWRFEIPDAGANMPAGRWTTASALSAGHLPSAPVSNLMSHDKLFAAYPDIANIPAKSRVGNSWSMSGTGPGEELGINAGSLSRQVRPMSLQDLKENRSHMLHELQHAVQQREGFAKGGSPTQFAGVSLADQHELDRINGILNSGAYDMRDYQTLLQQKRDILNRSDGASGFDQYRRLAGEAEARSVESRMDMTPAQRRATFPFDSFDVPRDKLILRDLLKGPAQSVYHRYTKGASPDNGTGYMMYADDQARIENGYGPNHWTVDDAKLPPGSIIDADSPEFQKMARHALIRDHETTKQYWNGQRSFRDLVRDLMGGGRA